MPFKMHKIIFFSRKKIIKKNMTVSLPYPEFSDLLPATLILLFGLIFGYGVWAHLWQLYSLVIGEGIVRGTHCYGIQ